MNRTTTTPITSRHPLGWAIVLLLCLATLWLPITSRAQEGAPEATSAEPQSDPETPSSGGEKKTGSLAADPTSKPDELKSRLRPLDRTELEAELEGWMALLKAKIIEVSEAGIEVNPTFGIRHLGKI